MHISENWLTLFHLRKCGSWYGTNTPRYVCRNFFLDLVVTSYFIDCNKYICVKMRNVFTYVCWFCKRRQNGSSGLYTTCAWDTCFCTHTHTHTHTLTQSLLSCLNRIISTAKTVCNATWPDLTLYGQTLKSQILHSGAFIGKQYLRVS